MTEQQENNAGHSPEGNAVLERSIEIGDLIKALAKAQGEIGEIARNKTVTVQPRAGGNPYHFKYASLDAIIAAIKKPLSDNGIARTQTLSYNAREQYYILTTTLHHGNQFISSKVPLIAEGGTNQQFGSALTYMKRYALAALMGISADEDDDGNAADGNTIVAVKDRHHPAALGPDPMKPAKNDAPQQAMQSKDNIEKVIGEIFSDALVPVPLLRDESGSDWMAWGKEFMAMARSAPDAISLAKLENANALPLKNMEMQAPKMYTNLTLSLIKVRKLLEKTS